MIEIPSIVSWLMKNFIDVMPVKVIHEYELGVKFNKGVASRIDLKAGIHWYIPFKQSIQIVERVEQVDSLEPQSLTTRDEKVIILRCNVKYSIWRAWRLWVMVHDPYDSLFAETRGFIAGYVNSVDYETLRTDTEGISKEITKMLQPKVRKWGFKVKEVNIVELVEAIHYRVVGDTKNAIINQ